MFIFLKTPNFFHIKMYFNFLIIIIKFVSFSHALAKLRKANVSFVMSVCPSAWNNLASTRRILMKLDL
jgi:hypothetical protein